MRPLGTSMIALRQVPRSLAFHDEAEPIHGEAPGKFLMFVFRTHGIKQNRISGRRPVVLAWVTAGALLMSAGSGALADPVPVDGLDTARLERIGDVAREYIEQGRLPGAVWAVARRGGPPHLGTAGPLAPDTIFRIYSMTKPVTAVAVLMLYEEGRFLLGDPVSRYLPEFADMQVYTGDGQRRAAKHAITIKQLLTHTAGLTYDDDAPGVSKLYAEADIWRVSSLDEFSRRIASLPLAFEPGSRWHYSVSYDVLGRLVEVLSGEPFDEFLAERIFRPLDMSDTGFRIAPEKLGRLAPLYHRSADGMQRVPAGEDGDYRDPNPVPFGGGGLLSTVGDYLRFARMLLNEGELEGVRLLSRKTVELMMMDQLPAELGEPKLNESWLGRTENRNGDLHLGLGYGLGGYVITDVAENAVPGSVGTYAWGGGASTYFFVDRKEQLAGVFLTQLTPSDSYPLRAQFRALVYQAIVD